MSYQFRERLTEGNNASLGVFAAVVALVLLPFVLGGFQTFLLAETLIFVLFATSFNLLYGFTGLLSFGHAMFIAAGGYTTAKVVSWLAPTLGFASSGGIDPIVSWTIALVLGFIASGALAALIGYFAVKLEEIYFALITLAFSMAIYVVLLQDLIGELLFVLGLGDGSWSNESDGLAFSLNEVSVAGLEFRFMSIVDPFAYYFFVLLIVLIGMYALYRVVQSPFGMICRAIRENPERAEALGVNVTTHRWTTFVISGAFSGLAGVMLVTLETGVNPEAHAFWVASADPVVMTIIGGPYSFLGPAVGAFVFEYGRWFITQFPALEAHWEFWFGLIILTFVLFFDNGVAGGINRFRAWLALAQSRYEEEGVSGVVALTSETISKYKAKAGKRIGGLTN